jgi:Ni/Co efflux regulator RcnB
MRSYTVPTLTAMAVGLCLVTGAAVARDRDNDGDRDRRGEVTRQKDDSNRGDRRRSRQQQQAPQPQQSRQQRRGWDGDRNNNRRGNWNNERRDRNVRDNRFDNDRRLGDRDRDRRFDNRRNDRRFGDRDSDRRFDRRDRDRRFGNRDGRRGDWAQFRRSYDAPRRFRVGVYHAPRGYSYRRWHHGERLPRAYFARNYWLTNFVIYGLFAPPPGLMWVRYGPDALLIDTYTGEIVQVRYNVFYY